MPNFVKFLDYWRKQNGDFRPSIPNRTESILDWPKKNKRIFEDKYLRKIFRDWMVCFVLGLLTHTLFVLIWTKYDDDSSGNETTYFVYTYNIVAIWMVSFLFMPLYIWRRYEVFLNVEKERNKQSIEPLCSASGNEDEQKERRLQSKKIRSLLEPKEHLLTYYIKKNSGRATVETVFENYLSSKESTEKDMAYELLRFGTFYDFPKSNGQSCIRLAQAGFYYKHTDDEVTCFSCSVKIRGWQPNDTPLECHWNQSSKCPFLKLQNVGNVPISIFGPSAIDGGKSTVSPIANPDEKMMHGSNDAAEDDEKTKTVKPSFSLPQTSVDIILSLLDLSDPPDEKKIMASEMLRLCTLQNFPKSDILSSVRLAQAGLFYEGNGDEVKCFCCSVQISGWQKNDIPFERHRTSSNDCAFINCGRSGNIRFSSAGRVKVAKDIDELIKENRILKEMAMCKICQEERSSIVLLPCRHLIACSKCAPKLSRCVECKNSIQNMVFANRSTC